MGWAKYEEDNREIMEDRIMKMLQRNSGKSITYSRYNVVENSKGRENNTYHQEEKAKAKWSYYI